MKPLTVYSASAGSGKTFTLAARYIALLLDGQSARSILAVTFTKKATAEMKARILSNLYALSRYADAADMQPFMTKVREFMSENHQNESFEVIQKMAARQLKSILEDYDHFTVTTIDAFLQMLLGEVARIAGLQTNFKVELNDQDVIDGVIDKMVSHLEMLDSETKIGIRKMIRQKMEDEKGWDVRKQLKQLSKIMLYNDTYLKEKDQIEGYLEKDKRFEDYVKLLKTSKDAQAVVEMKKLVRKYDEIYGDNWKCGNGNQTRWTIGFVKRVRKSLANEISGTEYFKGISNSASDYMGSDKFKSTYEGPGTAEELSDLILEMNELCGECRIYELNFKSTTQNLNELSLLNSISKAVDEDNREANRILLSMTPILLREILEQGADTMFVLEKAGVRFSHVMIDEFQDTSHVQWENFLPLLNEILSRGGTTLLVGDVKQSIYRFRGGDWDILKNIRQETLEPYFNDGRGSVESLTRNFRSEQNVVEFNMEFFPKAAAELDKLAVSMPTHQLQIAPNGIEEIYDEHYKPEKLQDFCHREERHGLVDVRIYPFSNERKAEETKDKDEIVENQLRDMFDEILALLKKGMPEADMMILLRDKKRIYQVTSYLNAHQEAYKEVTLVSSDAFKLSSSVSVEMLVCALRYLVNPADKVALVYLVRHYQNEVLEQHLEWTDFMEKPEQFLPAGFDRKKLMSKPLYEMTEELMRLFFYNGEGRRVVEDDSYVFAFMDEMLAFLSDNTSDAALFLEYWDDTLNNRTIPAPAVSKGIRILTIHKVKGLEARTVFLPLCDWDLEKDKNAGRSSVNGDVIWCRPEREPYNQVNTLLPVSPGKDLSETIYQDDYAQEHYKRRIDNLNLLYVAFTRAKENMFVFCGCEKKLKTLTTVGDLMALVTGQEEAVAGFGGEDNFIQAIKKGTFEILKKEAPVEEGGNRLSLPRTNLNVSMSNNQGRMKFRQSNRSHDFIRPLDDDEERQQNEYIRQGNLCHQIFSAIRTPEDVESVLKNFRDEGLIDTEERENSIRAIIARGWKNPQVLEWFDSSWTLFRECNILTRDANGTICKRRPDRVMMRGEETMVIDYKFGVPKPDYEEQVREYMTLLSRMGRRGVKGFIWYVYEGKTVAVEPSPVFVPSK